MTSQKDKATALESRGGNAHGQREEAAMVEVREGGCHCSCPICPAGTFLRRKRQPVLGTMSRSQSSEPTGLIRVSPGLFQPIAADDVAAFVADVARAAPRNGIVEIAGPERAPFSEIVARYLKRSATRARS